MSVPEPSADLLYFDDFPVGLKVEIDGPLIEEQAMLEFARRYDPQAFHVNRELARASPYGGLIASGFMTASLTMRMICDAYLARSAGIGSPGLSELSWLRPVRAGDRLHLTMTVIDTRSSNSKPDRGFVTHRWQVFNQSGDEVMVMVGKGMFLRRPA